MQKKNVHWGVAVLTFIQEQKQNKHQGTFIFYAFFFVEEKGEQNDGYKNEDCVRYNTLRIKINIWSL